MTHDTIQTGANCVVINGKTYTLREAAEYAFRITTAIRMVQLMPFRREVANAGAAMVRSIHARESLARDSTRDQRFE